MLALLAEDAAQQDRPVRVWEHGEFTEVVMFGRSATAALGSPYGLDQTECVELLRIALRQHDHPVTRMVAASLRQLRVACPGLRLIVSYADTAQGHRGGIYQAGNWIYTGTTNTTNASYVVHGQLVHGRTLRHMAAARSAGETAEAFVRRTIDPDVRRVVERTIKHRYLYPLDRAMRRQIISLATPYPRHDRTVTGDTRTEDDPVERRHDRQRKARPPDG